MVDEECRRYKPSKNYLDHLPPLNTGLFETDLIRNEFQRIEGGVRMETMNTKRYELPTPPSGKLGEIQAWQECVDNSFAQLEHQSIRYLNLELLQKYGIEAWKSGLEVLISLNAKAQKELLYLKKEIQDVNWRRKNKQLQTGDKLNQLNNQWVSLVSCNFEIESAIKQLEVQINTYKAALPQLQHTEEKENVEEENHNGSSNSNGCEDNNEEIE
jgi:pre-mRNA-splicing factor SPF27